MVASRTRLSGSVGHCVECGADHGVACAVYCPRAQRELQGARRTYQRSRTPEALLTALSAGLGATLVAFFVPAGTPFFAAAVALVCCLWPREVKVWESPSHGARLRAWLTRARSHR